MLLERGCAGLGADVSLADGLDPAATERVLKLAVRLAIEAPMKQGRYVSRAGVDWETIHELRRELEAVGFDWQSLRLEVERLEMAQRVERLKRIEARQKDQAERQSGLTSREA